MSEIPEEVQALGRERETARAAKDFSAADALRDRIRALGYDVLDGADGPTFEAAAEAADPQDQVRIKASEVASVLDEPATTDFSVQWVVQGWPEDAVRGIDAFQRFAGEARVQYVVVDCAGTDAGSWPEGIEVVALDQDPGWAAAQNAGLRRATGATVIVVDGSIEPTGEVLAPLEEALADPAVGVVGPFGIVTDDLREFRDSSGEGPERAVDAVEGYLMAFHRDLLATAGMFDEKFKFYRTADIEYSFRVKDEGLRAQLVTLPLERHEHRMWANTPPDRRDALSKRNFYRFLDRWRGRTDLTVSGGMPEPSGPAS